MKTYVKNYIGKGKQVAGLSIARVTCKLEDLEKFAYEFEGVKYVTFEVAKMKSTDSFGRDYTAYVNKMEDVEDEPKKSSKPAGRLAKKTPKAETVTATEDLPF
jgi:hypothetical protein